ncbi:MAG: tetratricopeptide repeat protein [Lutibacter sp.]|jgi:tetratricopeptide (TPR) repeat protein|nr:tetratricopeptide repeat protein [Lutibacter sp.]
MATYKKTGTKIKSSKQKAEQHSTTAEVFDTLDQTASRSEQWVIKNQGNIFKLLGLVVAVVLASLAYQKFVKMPQEKEAADELAFPKTYFENAMTGSVAKDSLLTLGLNGNDGKYGFVDIADQYAGTDAGNLANYYAGISYLNLKNYEAAIRHLELFSSDDELLSPIAKGAIGDAFADINQPEEALEYYLKAADIRSNDFSTPLFLFKAGNTALELGKYPKALALFEEIKNAYPNADEARNIEVYINKAIVAEK